MQHDTPLRTRIESVKTHRDPRGSLFEPLDDGELSAQRNVHVVLTEPNGVRGNHVHSNATETTTVMGPCLVRLKEAGAIHDVLVPPGEVWKFIIPPGVVHAYRNTGDAVMVLVSFSTNVHDPDRSDTSRDQIL
jgi:dTDP-4-dehydrorhamnose 3,5-epimerase-like enzyme